MNRFLRLAQIHIPVEFGMIAGSSNTRPAVNYQFGIDAHGALYLTYRHTWPSIQANRPRLSVTDPQWSPNHGLRYVEWVAKC